jgi:hypothetical protein
MEEDGICEVPTVRFSYLRSMRWGMEVCLRQVSEIADAVVGTYCSPRKHSLISLGIMNCHVYIYIYIYIYEILFISNLFEDGS